MLRTQHAARDPLRLLPGFTGGNGIRSVDDPDTAATAIVSRRVHCVVGIPADKLRVKPNFVAPDPQPGAGNGNYAIFAGRLSEEKGLDTLLAAWKQLTGIPLEIVGDGPLLAPLKDRAAALGLSTVRFHGRLPRN